MPQTSYSIDPVVAVPGMAADGNDLQCETFIANVDLAFGRAVRIRADKKVEYPTDDTGSIVGVTVYRGMTESTLPQGSAVIKAGTPVAVCFRGDVWMEHTGAAGTERGTVKLDDVTGKSTGAAPSAGTIRDMSSRAIFVDVDKHTSTLAKVRWNLP